MEHSRMNAIGNAVTLFEQAQYREAFAEFVRIYHTTQEHEKRQEIFHILEQAYYLPNETAMQSTYAANCERLAHYPYQWGLKPLPLDALQDTLHGIDIPTKQQWFAALFLANAQSLYRELNARIAPAIFHVPHVVWNCDSEAETEKIQDIYHSFPYTKIFMAVLRTGKRRICSGRSPWPGSG